ncbi:MAG: hypothetical protein NC548_25565 [Lachnospiraceae bacterium]|nr:hypothetical protein [Lachnospiraceae bacterium]
MTGHEAKLTADKTFDYGGWKDVWFIKDNYPCMLKSNGKEDYRLDPNDYSKKALFGASATTVSGATVPDFCNPAYDGNAMSAIPLCWVQRYEDSQYEYFVVC